MLMSLSQEPPLEVLFARVLLYLSPGSQLDLKLTALLPWPPKCWDSWCMHMPGTGLATMIKEFQVTQFSG